MILSWIITAVAVLALIKVWSRQSEGTVRLFEALVWSLVWIGITILFWQPEITSRLAERVGVGRGADLAVYSAIIIVFYILFRLFVKVDSLDRQITILNRSLALNEKKDSDTDRKL